MSSKDRDDSLRNIRPSLPIDAGTSGKEQFQNQVLRPILKFQNDLLSEMVWAYCLRMNKGFRGLKTTIKTQFIKQAMKQDPELKLGAIHIVVALMTKEDYTTYLEDRPEYNKRIIQMATQRILSQGEFTL